MKLLIGIITVASVVTMHSAPAWAQESATVVLRSGESVSGELIDLATAGFTVRQNAVERQIPFDLVAAVDFIGEEIPDSQWGMIADGRHVLSLRNGAVVRGHLHDVGGRSPLRITFESDDERRDYVSSQVARILLASRASVPKVPTSPGTLIDLAGTYFAPSSRGTADDAMASATTDPRGDRRGEGQVYEKNLGLPAPEGTYTPFSDEFKRPQALDRVDLRGLYFRCDIDLHNRDLWLDDAEFFQLGAGRQADPEDTDTEEVFVFIYRAGSAFALYMETDWALYRPETTYYSAADETKFHVRVAVNTTGTEALLTVIPLNGYRAGAVHTVNPLPLDLRNDNVRNASFFAGFTQNSSSAKSNAKASVSACAIEEMQP